mmetsp:Transcript_34119/g.75050  ORF Transcript_34119/g.75050 Transcript_34119/m.75050 type:complete len:293 (-) Transcript_34119:3702-4580(-)
MENIKDINGIPAHPGGYDGRRMAPNGGYTNAGERVAIGMNMEGSYEHGPDCDATEGATRMSAAAAGTSSFSTSSFGGGNQQLAFGGISVTPTTAELPSYNTASPAETGSSMALLTTMTSFGSTTSTASTSARKRKCSGDGVDTCGSCGHRLLVAPQRVTGATNRNPVLDGYCPSCVCRCALCGRSVLRNATASTVLDESLLMPARELGIPIEDDIAMGQDIGIMALVCEAGCISRLNRMRRMAKRKSSELVTTASTCSTAKFDNTTCSRTGILVAAAGGGDGEGDDDGMDLG